jgi:uncharacterized repeat protein (TIGR03833 family)
MDAKSKSGGKSIPKKKILSPKKSRSLPKKPISLPKKGDKVEIIIKPYKSKITKIGIIKDVLTKKQYHSRGHKVRLEDGTIGRIVKKLK